MKVELVKHVATNIATQKEVEFDEQLVVVDGKRVGKIGNAKNSKIAWFGRPNASERKEISEKVSELIGHDAFNDRIAPELPKELIDDEDDLDDDIDD